MSPVTETPRQREARLAKPRERRSDLWRAERHHLLPEGLEFSASIAEPGARARAAVDRRDEAQSRKSAADAEAAAAPQIDQAAVNRAGVSGGKVPKATAPAKRAAAEQAARELEAAEQFARGAVRDLYDAVGDNYDDFLEVFERAVRQEVDPLRELIPELVRRLQAFREVNAGYQAAARWHNNPNSALLTGSAGDTQRQFGRALTKREQQGKLRPNAPVDNELGDLLAALALKIETEVEGRG